MDHQSYKIAKVLPSNLYPLIQTQLTSQAKFLYKLVNVIIIFKIEKNQPFQIQIVNVGLYKRTWITYVLTMFSRATDLIILKDLVI